jgi:hypothetical protein
VTERLVRHVFEDPQVDLSSEKRLLPQWSFCSGGKCLGRGFRRKARDIWDWSFVIILDNEVWDRSHKRESGLLGIGVTSWIGRRYGKARLEEVYMGAFNWSWVGLESLMAVSLERKSVS